MGQIKAGVGGERWHMLTCVLERMQEGGVVALATSMWLYEAWDVTAERDEVRDLIWRAWRALDSDTGHATGWVARAVTFAADSLLAHDVSPSLAWRGHLGAALLWAWRVSTRRGIGWGRVSIDVYDGVVWPGRFVKSLPGTGSANDLTVGSWQLLAGVGQERVKHGHEAGFWVVQARMMSVRGDVMSFSGEMCQALMLRLSQGG